MGPLYHLAHVCHQLTTHQLTMTAFLLALAVPGEGAGDRVTEDDEKDKSRAGSQQHHESREAHPTPRLHMTDVPNLFPACLIRQVLLL
jgi:hypothetical protein